MAKLPTDRLRPAQDLLQVARKFPFAQKRQELRAYLAKKCLEPAQVPRAHHIGHSAWRERIEIAIPIRGASRHRGACGVRWAQAWLKIGRQG